MSTPDDYGECRFGDRNRDGTWTCLLCRRVARPTTQPPHRRCKTLAIVQAHGCPFGPIVQRLTPEGLARLDRCRAANCGLMHKHNGNMVCVGRGKSCEWLGLWAAWLNSGRGCLHWLPVPTAFSEPHNDLSNSHQDE